MKIRFSEADEAFRLEVATWLADNLRGEFEPLRFRGGPGDEHGFPEERKAWERKLAEGRWTCVGWAPEHGGRGLSISQQVIFHEEYARAGGPGRMGHIGEGLAGPTIAAFGTEEQKRRLLPGIVSGTEFWCQGYSEPSAGSDLANVKTRAVLQDGQWRISGQKVWTSLAHESEWCFVIARTTPGSVGHQGLSFLLVPMRQAGVTVRPIEQLTGTSEFNEVFFDEALTDGANILGAPGDGWTIAMALLGFERGVSTLGQQMLFHNELEEIIRIARANGAARDPLLRQRIAEAWGGLRILRYNSLRMLSGAQDGSLRREAMIYKLCWANWHVALGKLAMDVLGPDAELLDGAPYALGRLQAMFLFSRSDSIYGGSNEIQRNIIAERALGMPREPRVRA
ncbi:MULTISPECIES: acyl-CoA dehydrogenase family protein [unclassified Pseudomonas]|uniref:acyl-CoA dehydrogenase family protein n=1 Tax=unclassified Pseudomonas TaxID=196821 RepID=UPI000DA7E437|nr:MULTISPECIES: acyl-CoA dehydrogenase family protein [unclassified Pseudomonas]MDW3711711.1 acyl-CoA dehydrogenase family protein [Pseudomonas sp. 2023EL-01195]PZE09448.1 acyl-CoA dehydrogenase [Pseudomonas sp. 57B-090624]